MRGERSRLLDRDEVADLRLVRLVVRHELGGTANDALVDGVLREALDDLLPAELDAWVAEATRQREIWKRDRVPMEARRAATRLNSLRVTSVSAMNSVESPNSASS